MSISAQYVGPAGRASNGTFVAGFNTWLRLGFAVRKGERPIAIIDPLPVKDRSRLTGGETGDTVTLFKTVLVFDRAQVDPIEGREQAPLGPPCEQSRRERQQPTCCPPQPGSLGRLGSDDLTSRPESPSSAGR